MHPLDSLKLKFYYDYLVQAHVYAEGPSEYHRQLTAEVTKQYFDPLALPKDARILDIGCGPGYFLNETKERGYTNVLGITLSPEDAAICKSNGHEVQGHDMSFLPSADGFIDESVDFIFLRHALEHSVWPIISLIEYNRVLKQGGKLYCEVPAPDCDRHHEENPNHYSILGQAQLVALFQRTGFSIDSFNQLEFDLTMPNAEGESAKFREKFYVMVVTKRLSLDIK